MKSLEIGLIIGTGVVITIIYFAPYLKLRKDVEKLKK